MVLPPKERREILLETRGHVLERLSTEEGAELQELLAELGEPAEYAARFLPSDAPPQVGTLQRFADLASGSWRSLPALLLVVAGYTAAFLALVAAVLKVIYPSRMGAWVFTDDEVRRFTFGLMEADPPGRELLGYWLVPLGLLLALSLHLLMAALLRRITRPSPLLPGAWSRG